MDRWERIWSIFPQLPLLIPCGQQHSLCRCFMCYNLSLSLSLSFNCWPSRSDTGQVTLSASHWGEADPNNSSIKAEMGLKIDASFTSSVLETGGGGWFGKVLGGGEGRRKSRTLPLMFWMECQIIVSMDLITSRASTALLNTPFSLWSCSGCNRNWDFHILICPPTPHPPLQGFNTWVNITHLPRGPLSLPLCW